MGATLLGANSPSQEIQQIYYLGTFDPQGQLPPTIYRIRVHGQASFISFIRFASGWVPAHFIDSLSSSVNFKEQKSTSVSIDKGASETLAKLSTGRRLMQFGPEGFREAPRDHRLVIVMGCVPYRFACETGKILQGANARRLYRQRDIGNEGTLIRDNADIWKNCNFKGPDAYAKGEESLVRVLNLAPEVTVKALRSVDSKIPTDNSGIWPSRFIQERLSLSAKDNAQNLKVANDELSLVTDVSGLADAIAKFAGIVTSPPPAANTIKQRKAAELKDELMQLRRLLHTIRLLTGATPATSNDVKVLKDALIAKANTLAGKKSPLKTLSINSWRRSTKKSRAFRLP